MPSSTRSTRARSRTPTATASATCAASSAGWTTWPSSASTSCGCRRSTASPQDDNGYDISDYQDVDPLFGTLADLDELIAGAARARHRSWSWTSSSTTPPTSTRGSSSPGIPTRARSATGTGGGRRATGMAAGDPGAEPTNWGSFFSGPGLGARRGDRRVLPAPVQPQAARPQLGEPGGPRGGLRDDALVARPRRRRLPDGRHQPHLQGRDAARRRRCPARPLGRRRPRLDVNGPRLHEFLAEMHREVFAGRRDGLLTVGEMPGVDRRAGARRSPTRPRRELDMVFTFEHVGLDHGPRRQVGPAAAAAARPQGDVRPLAGRAGRRRLELALLGQPRPAAGRLPVRRRRRVPR